MKLAKGVLIGIIYGIVLSLSLSLMFMLFAQRLAGGITSFFGESWLYLATIVPFILTFSMLSIYLIKREKPTNKKLWQLSFVSAFFITLYSGKIGALIEEYIVRGGFGMQSENIDVGINVEGVLIWGTIYTFVFLPISTPLAKWLIHVFQKLLIRFNIST